MQIDLTGRPAIRIANRDAREIRIANQSIWTAYVGLLDAFLATLFAAFSFRLLVSGYAGPCIRVRRSSDNAQLDIYFLNGWLDVTSLLAFAGAGSAFIVTWYDQSGGGRHRTNSTAATQPRIVNVGVAELFGDQAAPRFGLAAGMGLAGTGFALPQPFTIIEVVRMQAIVSAEHVFWFAGPYAYATSAPAFRHIANGTFQQFGTWAVNGAYTIGHVVNGAASKAILNGASTGTANIGTGALGDAFTIGHLPSIPARVFNGHMSDLVVLSGAAADADIISIQRQLGAPRGIIIP